MGSVDIPPFLREQQKAKVSGTPDNIPPFLKKKESEIEEKGDGVVSSNSSATLPTGTESTAPLASPLPLDVEGIFSFGSLRKKTTSLPANLPRANKEIQKVLTNVHFGDVKPQELSSLYNNDYSRENAKKVIKEYAPEIPESAIGSDQSWEVAANNINTKNRVNFITAESQGINQLDATINSSIENLKLPTTERAGQVTDYINELRSGLTIDDYSNNDKVSALIAKVQKLQDVEQRNYLGGDARNRSIQQTTTLLNELNDRLKYNISKTGVTPTINQLDEQINQAITGKVMQAERGTGEFDVSNDAEKANHFKLGLTAIEKTDPVLFKNVLGTVSQLKKVDDTDFTTISRIGQDIANTMKFRGGAYNPELIGTETEFDYSTFGQKVAEASATIGEWAKSKGYKNMNKFPERIIKQGAKETGIDNPEIVNTLISNENLLMYDAIPKSGWVDDIVAGVNQPLTGINSTLNSWSESPAETYMRSKAFDSNIGAQKVPNAKGEYSDILPSEREKFTTDMFRGLGQFIPQVLLTKGVGAVARGVVGTTGAVLSTQKAKNVSDFAGTAISTFLQSYGPSYEEHLQKTGDADTAALIGTIDGISSAGFELLLPDVKIADRAFAGLRQGLSNNLIDLVKKGGDPAELAQKARPFVQKFFTNAVGALAQENLEELGTTYVDFVTESIFDPASAKDRNLNKELWDTFKATSAAMVLPSILGAGGQSAQKDFTVKTLHSSAINFDNYKESLQKTLDKGYIDQAEFNGAVKLISTHKESIAQAPQQNINGAAVDKQKQLEYAYEDTKIKVYKEKAATSEGVAKEMWESKIKQSEDIQREILMPKAVEEAAPAVAEPAVESAQDENLLTQLKENAPDIQKGENIQYFIDKAAEDPAAFMEIHGKKATNQLLEKVPTEKLIENRDFLVKNFSESESTDFLTQIISQREKSSTPMQNQEGATGVVPSTLKERSEKINPILTRINDADYINENELDGAADELYNALDDVEKDNTYTPEQKENARNLIEPIISKIEGYEFRTKTETRKVAETKATQIAKPTRQRQTKTPLESSIGKRVAVTTPTGVQSEGILRLENGNYTLFNENGDKVASRLSDVNMRIPAEEEVQDFIEFDDNGAVKAVTLKDINGNLIKISDPIVALDIAIQLRADAIGEVTPEEFDTVYETIEREVQEEVLVNQQNKPVTDGTQKTTATTVQPATQGTTPTVEPTTKSETNKSRQAETTPTRKDKVTPSVKSLTDELRALLGNEAAAFAGDTNIKTRISFKDLGLTDTDTPETFIDKLIAYGGEFTDILKAIKADPNFENVKLQLVDRRSGLENEEAGLYFPVGYGEDMDYTLQVANKDNVYYTSTHELLHFLTLDGDVANQIKNTPSYQALEDMYNYIASQKGKPVEISGVKKIEDYGLTNVKEFMAELLINPSFRKYAGDVFATNKDDIIAKSKAIRDNKVDSIGDIIFNFFRDLFSKLFSSEQSDIPFDEKKPVIDNAAKLATQLFFGGQDVTVGQVDSGEGATVLGIGSSDIRTAALAFPSTNKDEVINSFVKSALDRGESEADIKQALVNNGISDTDAQSFIDTNKPAPPKATTAKSENEIISTVLNQRIDARTFPSIFQENETGQQIAAGTQGAGQQREVDGAYVVALESDLREVSIQSAHILRDELGADWGIKTLAWIEKNPSQGNIAQVVGLLNIISTDNYQDIQDTHDGNRVRKLSAIQRRIDVVAMQRARDASLALRQRILYAKFAQGGNMADVVAQSILSPEMMQLQTDLNEILSEPVTDEEINSAPPLKTTKPKKQSPIRKAMGTAKRKSNPAIKDELITKGAEAASKTKKSFKELIEDAKNKLKNTKC